MDEKKKTEKNEETKKDEKFDILNLSTGQSIVFAAKMLADAMERHNQILLQQLELQMKMAGMTKGMDKFLL